jgi:hypothetical protein
MRAQEFLAGVGDNEHCGLAPAALQTANPQGDLCDVQEAAGLFPPRKRMRTGMRIKYPPPSDRFGRVRQAIYFCSAAGPAWPADTE